MYYFFIFYLYILGHGTKYHIGLHDNYPEGCPNKLVPEKLIKNFAEKEIILYGIRINSLEDIMFTIF